MDSAEAVLFGLIALGVVAIVAILLARGAEVVADDVSASMRRRAQQREAVRRMMERRAAELFVEFPALDDASIADLMRDELVNARTEERELFQWATPETVGRMRRTIVVAAIRDERARERAPVHVEIGPAVRVCHACAHETRPDALRCPKCAAWFS